MIDKNNTLTLKNLEFFLSGSVLKKGMIIWMP